MIFGSAWIALAGIGIELALGYPSRLYARIGHPVGWAGALLGLLERTLNRDRWSGLARRLSGLAALLLLLLAVGLPAFLVDRALPSTTWAFAIRALVVAVLVAPRNLYDHVRAVWTALTTQDLDAARMAVSRIVGRDPETLDDSGVCRAAIESLAENFSDGVIAPLVWYLAGGFAGIALYKAINTADSMIGHHNARYEMFGWAAARLDDIVNLPASRLTGLLIAIAAGRNSPRALRVVWRDAGLHRSPNAGWPEAAMAGALGIRLAGPRVYGDRRVDDPWLGDGSEKATAQDLRRALALYRRALAAAIVLLIALALI